MNEELRVEGLHAGYGAVPVLAGVDLVVARGGTVALLGRNGVGKTTLLRSIMGMTRIYDGRIALGGRDVTRQPTFATSGLGIQYVPEDRGIFNSLTVQENLRVGDLAAGGRRRGRRDALRAELFERFPILRERLRQPAGVLSGGERQILAIARALLAHPRFLLLDEFSEGLQPSMVRALGGALRDLRGEERGILLVEQDARFALTISDEVYVMEKGGIVDRGPAADFRDDEQRLLSRLVV